MSRLIPALLRRARFLAIAGGVGLMLPLLTRVAPLPWDTASWLLDLTVHWQWLYAALTLVGSVGVVLLSKRLVWLAAVPLALLPLLTAAPVATASAPQAGHATLTVAEANVYVGNPDPSTFLAWLKTSSPDVAVVLEVSPRFGKTLEGLKKDYPHQRVHSAEDAFGIAVLSRFPLQNVRVLAFDHGEEYLHVTLDWQGQPVELAAVHPVPPVFSPNYYRSRDRGVAAVSAAVQVTGAPALVVGDLNATAWSTAFNHTAGLQRSTSLAPTWHSMFKGLFGIPIDHALVSDHWRVVDRERGPHIGSDHLPVLVKLQLAEAPPCCARSAVLAGP